MRTVHIECNPSDRPRSAAFRSFRLLAIALLVLAGYPEAWAQTGQPGGGVSLEEDLRAVIVLAGYPCSRVGEVVRTDTTDYRVTCVPDGPYRVRVSEEEKVVVESVSEQRKAAAPGDESHEELMKRSLFSIVNLAGHPCASVLAYEYRGPRENVVTCDDQTIYRIYVTPEGRVAVDPQTVDK